MPITEILERNVELYGDDICLVEINPEIKEVKRISTPITTYNKKDITKEYIKLF